MAAELGYSPWGEDTHALRLTSELADLRSGYANPDIQSLPLGVSFAMIVRLGCRGEQHLLARQDTADGGMHSLLTSPLAKADSFSSMSGFVSELQFQNKKPTTRSAFYFGSGTRIRTQTYRVRVCCATFTQFRYAFYSRLNILTQKNAFVNTFFDKIVYFSFSPF